jgi:hypothetical protein
LDWNHRDSKNPPTYRIHGYDRRRLKKEKVDLIKSIDRGWGDPVSLTKTLKMVNEMLSEPYGMVRYNLDKHKL